MNRPQMQGAVGRWGQLQGSGWRRYAEFYCGRGALKSARETASILSLREPRTRFAIVKDEPGQLYIVAGWPGIK